MSSSTGLKVRTTLFSLPVRKEIKEASDGGQKSRICRIWIIHTRKWFLRERSYAVAVMIQNVKEMAGTYQWSLLLVPALTHKIWLLEQHSREDFDIMSVLRPVIPLLAGTCLSSASYNTRELINGLYFWFPQRKGKVSRLKPKTNSSSLSSWQRGKEN